MTFKGDLWQRRQCTLCSKGVYTCLNSRIVNRKTSLMIRYTVYHHYKIGKTNVLGTRWFGRIKFLILNICFDFLIFFNVRKKRSKPNTIVGYHQTKLIQINCYYRTSFHAVQWRFFGQENWALTNFVLLFIKHSIMLIQHLNLSKRNEIKSKKWGIVKY